MTLEFKIANKPPTYSSDTLPVLEQKLIDRIVDFLWDEPVQLFQCSLVCAAWYGAARRHLMGFQGILDIDCERDLSDFAHILLSPRNKQYGRAVRILGLEDSPEARFAHTLPDYLPGSLLPNVTSLNFSQLDWAAESSRPRDTFFTWLTSFDSVTSLYLEDCRFRHADDIHSFALVLPKLKELHIDTSAVEGDPPSSAAWSRQARPASTEDIDALTTSASELSIAENALTAHPTVMCLHVNMTLYHSFPHFQRFMQTFPSLREVLLGGDPSWSVPDPSDDTVLLRIDTPMDIWPMLALHNMSAGNLVQFIGLLTAQFHKIREVNLSLHGPLTPTLEYAIEELTRMTGPELTSFFWDSCRDKEALQGTSIQHVPFFFPSFTQNVNLRSLSLLTVMPSRQGIPWVYRTLSGLLSRITSPCLEDLAVQFCLDLEFPLPWAEADLGEYIATPDTIAAFHALLRRPEFDRLPRGAVNIGFYDWSSPDKSVVQCASAEISQAMVPLFAPWLERGVAQLEILDIPRIDQSAYTAYAA